MKKTKVLRNTEVIQSYILTTARYDFNVDEKRILTNIVGLLQPLIEGQILKGHIQKDLWGFYQIEVPLKELTNETDAPNYKRIKDALTRLRNKTFEYEDSEHWELIGLIEKPSFEKRGIAKFELNPKIFECFLNFTKGYSKYELEMSLSFNSVYASRLYELLNGTEKPITYNIEKLKEMFGVTEKYKYTKDFISKCIDTAQKELNEKSPITFTYEKNTEWKKIVSITFTPKYIKSRINIETAEKELKRELGATQIVGDALLVEYLRNSCDFTEKEILNNGKLFHTACHVLGKEIDTTIRKLKSQSITAKNPKAYIVGTLRKIVNEKLKQ